MIDYSTRGHQAKRPRMALDPGNAGIRNAYYDDIILEDLTTTSTQDRIILETRDRSQYTSESKKDEDEDREAKMGEEEMEEVIRNTKLEFERWEPRLNDVRSSSSLPIRLMRADMMNIV